MDLKKLGERIKKLRELRGFTQSQLGDLINKSESYVSYIEKGQRTVAADVLAKMAHIFNVDHNYFFSQPSGLTMFRHHSSSGDDHGIDTNKLLDDFIEYAKKH